MGVCETKKNSQLTNSPPFYRNINTEALIPNSPIISSETNNVNEINNVNNGKNDTGFIQNNSNKSKLNQITIKYKIYFSDKYINLFGEFFVKNNIDNCYLLIDGQQRKLCEKLELSQKQKEKWILEIKLIETKKITDISSMFSQCKSLDSLPDISQWDTKYVNNMSFMFYCTSIFSLPDISQWDTKNVTDMSLMFYGCSSLNNLEGISKWDTKSVTDMSQMFYGIATKKIPKNFLNK